MEGGYWSWKVVKLQIIHASWAPKVAPGWGSGTARFGSGMGVDVDVGMVLGIATAASWEVKHSNMKNYARRGTMPLQKEQKKKKKNLKSAKNLRSPNLQEPTPTPFGHPWAINQE